MTAIITGARIQLRRSRGWRMPRNAVKVDRSTRWGNPFIVGEHGTRERCVQLYRYLLSGRLCVSTDNVDEQKSAIAYVAKHIHQLVSKDLACWCPLDKPCHADVLLEVLAAARARDQGIRDA